jgi:D-threo-aldose 1-dehydrogenase
MMAGSWNLLDQDGLDVLLECQARGIRVHNAGIFASGLLVGGSHYKYAPAPPEILARTERWRALAASHAVPLPAVALAFACAPTAVRACAVGVKSPEEVAQNIAWLDDAHAIPHALWIDAASQGLLDPAFIPELRADA